MQTNKHLLTAALLVVSAIVIAGCGYSALDPGNPMPSLSAEGWTNGSEPDLSGKVIVIEAFATW